MRYRFFHSLVVFIFFISTLCYYCPTAWAADSDVVINEIGASEASDHEWIELYNRGSNPVDLTGWKFFEDGTNHGITAFRGGMIVAPGGYAIIADVAVNTAADYPAYSGIIIDSSWSTLNEGGESLAIKNAGGVIIEQFTYVAASQHSLERVDAGLADYKTANWKEHVGGNTIGVLNSVQPIALPLIDTGSTGGVVSGDSGSTGASSGSSIGPGDQGGQASGGSDVPVVAPVPLEVKWHPSRGEVVINEILADPTDGEKEWIELYNTTDREVDLKDWTIEDGSKAVTALSGALSANGAGKFLVIENPKGSLNNAGDLIILRNETKASMDEVSYGNWDDGNVSNNAPRANDPYSIARLGDGINSFNNGTDFAVTTTPSRGASNVITREIVSGGAAVNSSSPQIFVKDITISEVYPNPIGDEVAGEFIEIKNTGSVDVSLLGWQVVSGSGKKYTINEKDFSVATVKAGDYFIISRKVSGLALKNTGGDSVKLYQSIDAERPNASMYYRDKGPEGQSFALDEKGEWRWTTKPTPGLANVFVIKNSVPEVAIDMPSKALVGDVLVFDASDTTDNEHDPLAFLWQMGDGGSSTSVLATHAYSAPGDYEVSLIVKDGVNMVTEKKKIHVTTTVNPLDVVASDGVVLMEDGENNSVILNEIYPNPRDSKKEEFVEIFNRGDNEVDLSGWTLETTSGKRYTFPKDTSVSGLGYLVVKNSRSKLTLSNAGETIGLVSGDGAVLDVGDYEDAPANKSFSRNDDNEWAWSDTVTESKRNIFMTSETATLSNDKSSVVKSKSTSVKKTLFQTVALSDVRELAKGTAVSVSGVVSVEPQILGKNIFYLAGSGVQVYMSSGEMSKLLVGDEVSVQGSLSESGGETRIVVSKTRGSIRVVKKGPAPEPHVVATSDVGEELEGSLVSLQGKITKMQWPNIYIDDGSDEVRAYVKKTTGIEKMKLKVGDMVALTGIVSETTSGYRILPRFVSDIVVVPLETEDNHQEEVIEVPNGGSGNGSIKMYLMVTALALGVLSIGLFFQRRRDKK